MLISGRNLWVLLLFLQPWGFVESPSICRRLFATFYQLDRPTKFATKFAMYLNFHRENNCRFSSFLELNHQALSPLNVEGVCNSWSTFESHLDEFHMKRVWHFRPVNVFFFPPVSRIFWGSKVLIGCQDMLDPISLSWEDRFVWLSRGSGRSRVAVVHWKTKKTMCREKTLIIQSPIINPIMPQNWRLLLIVWIIR